MTSKDVLFSLKPSKQQTILKLGPVNSPRKCTFLHSLLVKVFDENILVSILLCFVGLLIWHTVVSKTF